jgi:phage tail-like protein
MSQPLPNPSFHFIVEAGFSRIGFTRVHLPALERELIRYREGSDPSDSMRLLPGLARYGDCVLERGVVAADNEFFGWLNTAQSGSVERRDVTVKLLDASHQPVLVWRLRSAFPRALNWSVLDAQTSALLIESLTLAVERVEVEST